MSVSLRLALFPDIRKEMEVDSKVTGTQLRKLASAIAGRLQNVAAIVDGLNDQGWIVAIADYGFVKFVHPEISTKQEAQSGLGILGIDAKDFYFCEWHEVMP
jgi:hypothetical protein